MLICKSFTIHLMKYWLTQYYCVEFQCHLTRTPNIIITTIYGERDNHTNIICYSSKNLLFFVLFLLIVRNTCCPSLFLFIIRPWGWPSRISAIVQGSWNWVVFVAFDWRDVDIVQILYLLAFFFQFHPPILEPNLYLALR